MSGTGDIVEIPYDGGEGALELLSTISGVWGPAREPYTSVGWSKCNGCGYFERCWHRAVSARNVALLPSVEQGLAAHLREQGIVTFDQLLDAYSEKTLAEAKYVRGKQQRKVGKAAAAIIREATALRRNEAQVFGAVALPVEANYVMFDVEGLPPHLDETDKVYLWGLQVFGERATEYLPAVAGFEEDGDREGWEQFLHNCGKLLADCGDIPFVHWYHYEKDKVSKYLERHGDRDGVAARVQNLLLDLHPAAKNAVVLPDYSYSLKVVEKHAGFRRTLDEANGEWAMAKYIEATETEDAALREQVLAEILKYNEEDLAATWAVLQWLRSIAAQHR
jgi:predicted RecB family nuclease